MLLLSSSDYHCVRLPMLGFSGIFFTLAAGGGQPDACFEVLEGQVERS